MFCKDIDTYLMNFLTSMRSFHDPLSILRENVHAMTDIFWSIYAFINNEMEGTIKSEAIVGEVVKYRQKMIAKIGIAESVFDFLKLLTEIKGWDDEDSWENTMIESFKIFGYRYCKHTNLIDLIFDTVYSLVYDNYDNKKLAVKHMMTLQKFVFVDKLPVVLSIIFKRKKFAKDNDMNKEKLYSRIYEYDRIKPLIDNYIGIMKKNKSKKYMFILRRLCVIDENPLPLIQDLVFKELVGSRDNNLIYDVDYVENSKVEINNLSVSEPSRMNSISDIGEIGPLHGTMQIVLANGTNKVRIDDF